MKKKTNILHIVTDLGIGGAEKNLLSIVKNYNRDKFNVFVAYSSGGDLEREFKKSSVNLYKFQNAKLRFRSGRGVSAVFKLYRFIKKHKINLVHTHLFVPYFWGGLAAKFAKIKLINTVQNIRDDYVGKVYKRLRFVERIFSHFTEREIVYNKISKEVLVRRGIDEEKIQIISGGVKVSKLLSYRTKNLKWVREKYNLNDVSTVGISGSLRPVKNHELFLKAAERVLKVLPKVRFVITGDGPERERLKKICSELDISNEVIFTGFVDDLYSIIEIFDIFVLTSLSEGQPVVILEAMALGKPVIATAVGGIPEVIKNGRTGILVPSNDDKTLSLVIIDLLQDEEKRKKIATAGQKMVEKNYNISKVVEQVENLYLRILSD